MTDEAAQYKSLHTFLASHGFLRHFARKCASRDDRANHARTIERFLSVFDHAMKGLGVHQPCGHKPLDRYITEFDSPYNNRTALALKITCVQATCFKASSKSAHLCSTIGARS